jgi:hypothetical protein
MRVAVAPGIDGGLDLGNRLLGADDLLAREMTAALRMHLVFQLYAVGPGPLQRAHRVIDVERIAKAGVGIDDQRQLHRIADARRVLGDFMQAHEALVGHGKPHIGHAGAGDVDGLEAQVFDELGRQGIERAGHQGAAARPGQGLELLLGIHGSRPNTIDLIASCA